MVYTITLNPAFDVHAYTEKVIIDSENSIELISKDAGGKGVNISTALDSASIENKALIILGKENSSEFKAHLNLKNTLFIEVDGRIRENLTIHTDNKETRISYKGFHLNDNILNEIRNLLDIKANDIVTFTGSIPDGITKEATIDFLLELKKCGARLVIDSKSITMDELYLIQPWLIKPNEEEISAYFDKNINELTKAMECAIKIKEKGIDNVIISMGSKGAILASNQGEYSVTPPLIKAVSTIGAGDSMIAGFIYGESKELQKIDSFKYGISFGTAACLTQGTNPPSFDEIQSIFNQIK